MNPTFESLRAPRSGDHPSTPAANLEPLSAVVAAGLAMLEDLSKVTAVAATEELESRLRRELKDRPGQTGHVAARVACAHLAVGRFADAALALEEAQSLHRARVLRDDKRTVAG